jgi:hypothetical protein
MLETSHLFYGAVVPKLETTDKPRCLEELSSSNTGILVRIALRDNNIEPAICFCATPGMKQVTRNGSSTIEAKITVG